MLEQLRIKNFVLIEELIIDFKKGLNVLTGETGAGKSILIDAISGVLGDKMSINMIRTGNDKATLEGSFTIENLPQLKEILTESGIDFDDDYLIMRRELYASGKGRCFANSVQIPVSKMKEIAEYLLDIHGQNEHQNIVKISKHRELLDNYANLSESINQIKEIHKKLTSLKEAINSSEMDEMEKNRRIEYLQFAINEIEDANLSSREEEELKEESIILSNGEKIFNRINESSNLLRNESGIIQNLKKIENLISSISDMDSNISENLDLVRNALYSLEDSATFFRNYEQNIDFSPERINQVEERLSTISALKKKYGNTIADILSYYNNCKDELESISSSEERIENLKNDFKDTVKKAKEVALYISAKRIEAAKRLEDLVMIELSDLGMKGTKFRVSIKRELDPEGEIEQDNKRYILYPHGIDRVEFLLSANEGENLQQLRKVASGGEMSRIMLALKKVILSNDIVESLIFDEVDTGISGKTAEIVGKKLKSLSEKRQVLVITHLPQIAAMSDNHYTVNKNQTANRTFTMVKNLSKDEKIKEVARMLAGEIITDLSLKHAEEMVALAD